MESSSVLPFHSRLQMWGRHLRTAAKHMTVRKAANIMANEVEFRTKRTILRSLPYTLKIETSGICHLRCPGCPHGRGELARYSGDMILTLHDFKNLIDSLSGVLIVASLSGLGEALLNPDLCQMIAYCSQRNVGTEFPTTFSVKKGEDEIEQMVTAGLDHLIVSIDGTTQEVYEKYRKGGNLKLVLRNVSTLLKSRERLRSKLPFLEFKYIVFEHNHHQLQDAERMASDIGFDKFSAVLDNLNPRTYAYMSDMRQSHLAKKQACFWPWNTLNVGWDGTVYPCCRRDVSVGNVFKTDLYSLWNNEKFQKVRTFFKSQMADEVSRVCLGCMEF